jgi:hypothetical protein
VRESAGTAALWTPAPRKWRKKGKGRTLAVGQVQTVADDKCDEQMGGDWFRRTWLAGVGNDQLLDDMFVASFRRCLLISNNEAALN